MDDEQISPIQPARSEKRSKKIEWGPAKVIASTIFVYLGSMTIAALIVSAYPKLKGWSDFRTAVWLSETVSAQFFFILIAEIVTVYAIWWFLKKRQSTLRDIGLKKPEWRDIGYAVGGFFIYAFVYILLFTVITRLIPGLNTDQKQQLGFSTTVNGLGLYLTFISLVLLPPIAEEMLARGFLYTGLRRKLPVIVAAIITSAFFGIAHLEIGTGEPLLWIAGIDTFVLSLVLVYIRQKTDSLCGPIMLHMLKNGIAFTALFVLHVR